MKTQLRFVYELYIFSLRSKDEKVKTIRVNSSDVFRVFCVNVIVMIFSLLGLKRLSISLLTVQVGTVVLKTAVFVQYDENKFELIKVTNMYSVCLCKNITYKPY